MAPTVLLLHGFTNTGASWDPVVAALGERYRALAPDIRGHGSASLARPVTLEAVIGDIAGLAPGRFTLAGYSQGGRIALHAALTLAPRVERLVLIGASPGIADDAERAARRAADAALAGAIERMSIEEFADRWAKTPVLAGQPPAVVAAARADRLRNTPAALAAALRGLGTGALPSAWGRLGELVMPVTLVVGERDEKFRAVAKQAAGAIPRAEVVVVPGAGHAVHLEAPEWVAAAIAGRSAGQPGPSGGRPASTGRQSLLRLRPVSTAEAAAVLRGDLSALAPADGWPHSETSDALRLAITHGGLIWFVEFDGQVIGDCGTHRWPDASGSVEIGFGLAVPYRGRGLGRAMVAELVAELRGRPEIRGLVADTASGNVPSRRALEHAGFRPLSVDAASVRYALSLREA